MRRQVTLQLPTLPYRRTTPRQWVQSSKCPQRRRLGDGERVAPYPEEAHYLRPDPFAVDKLYRNRYIGDMSDPEEIPLLPASDAVVRELRELPKQAQQEIGYQLQLVQWKKEPNSWRPMPSVGPGCREVRVTTSDGIARSIYIYLGTDPKYVVCLCAFVKKTQKTPKNIIDTAQKRLKSVKEEIAEEHNDER